MRTISAVPLETAPSPGPLATALRDAEGTFPGRIADVSGDLVSQFDRLGAMADEHESQALSAASRRAYESDWRRFEGWCARYGRRALPTESEVLRRYVTDMAAIVNPDGTWAYHPSTISRHVAAISTRNRAIGNPGLARDAGVARVMAGIRKARAARTRRMRPLLLDDISAMLARLDYTSWPDGLIAARDAFALLLGFAGALRRSEVAALAVGDVTYHPQDGLHVFLAHSKTDQEGKGVTLALPFGQNPHTCPPCAWVRWMQVLEAAGSGRAALMRLVMAQPARDAFSHVCRSSAGPQVDVELPLLRAVRRGGHVAPERLSADALHSMVKRRAAAAGIDGADVGFHSLRAGFVTQARRNGADARAVRLQTRHGSDAMVDVYDREYNPLLGNAVTRLGL